MTELEMKFQNELLKKCDAAKRECQCDTTRLAKFIMSRGGISVAKDFIRKGIPSDQFEDLQKADRLDLTIESSVIELQYAELFSDDEVNFCYDLLCEYGFYK